MELSQGILVTLEGIDGSGKSSLISNLNHYFTTLNVPLIITKEPGGSALGKLIRTLLHDRPVSITPKAEYLLFAADRAEHFHEIIEPALAEKKLIISDRLADSSLVYQGYGRGLDLDKISLINTWAMNNLKPHLTIYIHIDVDTALARITKRAEKLTSFEQEARSFYEKLISGYTKIYKDRDDVLIIDGTKNPENIAHEAITKIVSLLS